MREFDNSDILAAIQTLEDASEEQCQKWGEDWAG